MLGTFLRCACVLARARPPSRNAIPDPRTRPQRRIRPHERARSPRVHRTDDGSSDRHPAAISSGSCRGMHWSATEMITTGVGVDTSLATSRGICDSHSPKLASGRPAEGSAEATSVLSGSCARLEARSGATTKDQSQLRLPFRARPAWCVRRLPLLMAGTRSGRRRRGSVPCRTRSQLRSQRRAIAWASTASTRLPTSRPTVSVDAARRGGLSDPYRPCAQRSIEGLRSPKDNREIPPLALRRGVPTQSANSPSLPSRSTAAPRVWPAIEQHPGPAADGVMLGPRRVPRSASARAQAWIAASMATRLRPRVLQVVNDAMYEYARDELRLRHLCCAPLRGMLLDCSMANLRARRVASDAVRPFLAGTQRRGFAPRGAGGHCRRQRRTRRSRPCGAVSVRRRAVRTLRLGGLRPRRSRFQPIRAIALHQRGCERAEDQPHRGGDRQRADEAKARTTSAGNSASAWTALWRLIRCGSATSATPQQLERNRFRQRDARQSDGRRCPPWLSTTPAAQPDRQQRAPGARGGRPKAGAREKLCEPGQPQSKPERQFTSRRSAKQPASSRANPHAPTHVNSTEKRARSMPVGAGCASPLRFQRLGLRESKEPGTTAAGLRRPYPATSPAASAGSKDARAAMSARGCDAVNDTRKFRLWRASWAASWMDAVDRRSPPHTGLRIRARSRLAAGQSRVGR